MLECNPKDQLVDRLIRTRIHMATNQRSFSEASAILDIFAGMYGALELIGSGKPAQKQRAVVKRDVANRIALIISGYKEYAKIQMEGIETFACCVETLGADVKEARIKIQTVRKGMEAEHERFDGAVAALKDPAIPESHILKIATTIQHSAFKKQSITMRDIYKQLYTLAENKIIGSLADDKTARKVLKSLVLPARADPGATDPI